MGAPTTRFDFDFEPPLKQFHFAVDRFAADLEDMGDLFRLWSGLFKKEMGEQFQSEGAVSGDPWVDLTDAYKVRKEEEVGFVYPIGVRTGALRSAMTGKRGYAEHIKPRSAEFGMDARFKAAQYGPFFAERRPVVRMTPAWGSAWQKEAHRWLADVSARDWGGALPKGMRTGGKGYQAPGLQSVAL